jgi:hypothetical protein
MSDIESILDLIYAILGILIAGVVAYHSVEGSWYKVIPLSFFAFVFWPIALSIMMGVAFQVRIWPKTRWAKRIKRRNLFKVAIQEKGESELSFIKRLKRL